MPTKRDYYNSLRSNPNVQRALASIREAEGTARYSDPYSVGFGGRQIDDLSQHPGVLSSFSDNSGGRKKTSAAGAYQFLNKSWGDMSSDLGLQDFGPESQDIAAIGLLDRSGALDNVLAGDVNGFVDQANGTWASLPGSPYNQPTRSRSFINRAWNSYTPMADIPNVPTPTPAPDLEGIMNARDPVSPAEYAAYSSPLSSVQRAPLKDVEMASFDAGRFGPQPNMQTIPDLKYDRFATTPFDQSRFGPTTTAAAGKNALRRGLLDQQLEAGILPSLDNPAYAAMRQPDYVDPMVTSAAVAQPASINTAHVQPPAFNAQPNLGQSAGLLSPQEQKAVAAQRAYLDQQPFNKAPSQFGSKAKQAAGSILGAVLGGLTLGPVGALGGGLLGNVVTRPGGLLGSNFPEAPKSQSRGNGQLTDYGKSVSNSSGQFSRAMASGGKGLY